MLRSRRQKNTLTIDTEFSKTLSTAHSPKRKRYLSVVTPSKSIEKQSPTQAAFHLLPSPSISQSIELNTPFEVCYS